MCSSDLSRDAVRHWSDTQQRDVLRGGAEQAAVRQRRHRDVLPKHGARAVRGAGVARAGEGPAVPVFYQAVQMVSLLTYSMFSWKMGWTYAPSNVSVWRMVSTNYQPVFQRESAAIEEELEKAKTALKEAQKDKALHSPTARSPENTVKGAGAASSILASVFPSAAANGRKVAPQPRQTGAADDDVNFSDSPSTPTRPGHLRTKSALGLGLGEIEQEALDKAEKGTSRKGHLHNSEADDLITPLRTRVKALEELNIQVARTSTRKTSYWDFVSVLQGSTTSVARSVSRIPGRISDSIMATPRFQIGRASCRERV